MLVAVLPNLTPVSRISRSLLAYLDSPKPILKLRNMASVSDSIPHTVRTVNDPRQTGLYNVTLAHIEQVNSKIRLLRLSVPRDGVCAFPLIHSAYRFSMNFSSPSVEKHKSFTHSANPAIFALKSYCLWYLSQSSNQEPSSHLSPTSPASG